jgi:diguanylate cyclase
MRSVSNHPATAKAQDTAPLSRVLGQSERVQDKVKQAASDLASVNAVLKDEMGEGVAQAKVGQALDQSEAVEIKVQEAAEELVVVNDALANEVSERHILEDRLAKSDDALAASQVAERISRHDALHDALTGLPNLTLFNDRLGNALAQARRHDWRLALMFIDLDKFKNINDKYGHDAGDHVLRMMAERLQTFVRSGDTVSRRSGDEFLLLMLEAKDQANVAAFAAKVADNIATAYEVDGAKLTVHASIGVAMYPEDGRSSADLLKHADMAMYSAKKKKAGLAFYGESTAAIPLRS